jgi:hypothetical protein
MGCEAARKPGREFRRHRSVGFNWLICLIRSVLERAAAKGLRRAPQGRRPRLGCGDGKDMSVVGKLHWSRATVRFSLFGVIAFRFLAWQAS